MIENLVFMFLVFAVDASIFYWVRTWREIVTPVVLLPVVLSFYPAMYISLPVNQRTDTNESMLTCLEYYILVVVIVLPITVAVVYVRDWRSRNSTFVILSE